MTTRHRLLLTVLAVAALALGGLPPTTASAAPDAVTGTVWVSLFTGRGTTCGIKADHSGWCWGLNESGQVGTGDRHQHLRPSRVPGSWTAFSIGIATTCGLDTSGTGWCWGFNQFGQVGDGTTTIRTSPTALPGRWTSVRITTATACGIRPDTSAWCWGLNNAGQVGDGTRTTALTPRQVPGTGWVSLSLSDEATCGVRADGSGWCWGNNVYGQLGNPATDIALVPTRLPGDGWLQVDLGLLGACGLRADRSAWCWGVNNRGQVGTGAASEVERRPFRLAGSWTSLAVDRSWITSCGGQVDGSLWCWGANTHGSLGQGVVDPPDAAPRPPSRVPGGPWTSAVTGGETVCAVADDRVWCWGSHEEGAAGVGDLGRRRAMPHPETIAHGVAPVQLTLAFYGGGCVVRSNGTAWCWGINYWGQLGDTTTYTRVSPVRVGAAPAA